MSKRSGDFFPLNKLLSEVNKDSIRFMMLYRINDVELDFDFNKVLEKNKENPVYYVQYCYARISSVFRNINLDIKDKVNIKNYSFTIFIYYFLLLYLLYNLIINIIINYY